MDREQFERRREELEAIESRVSAELEQAKSDYERSKKRFEQAREYFQDLGCDSPDSMHAVVRATLEYNRSLEAYRLALARFCDLVLRRTMPSD